MIFEDLKTYKTQDYFTLANDLKSQDLSALTPIRVGVLRSYSAEFLEVALTVRLILLGYNPTFFWGDYNQYTQEILDENSELYSFNPNLILLLVRSEELLPEFNGNYISLGGQDWLNEIKNAATQYGKLIVKLAESTNASILVQNFSLVSQSYLGIYDIQQPVSQQYLMSQFNFELTSVISAKNSIYIWDFNSWVLQFGWKNLYDPKMDYFAHNPFTSAAYIEMTNDLMPYIHSILGKQKKCVVLDLDNTLWGGVVGEDGLGGIKLGKEYPGNCYLAFQEALLKLTHRGIVLALNSKNNEADVADVFANHPEIVIEKTHIVAERINWQDKASNLKEIAAELNIGLDSMIFIDDNPAECELIKQELPEVTVVMVPSKPYLIPGIVNNLPFVENIRITKEDLQKSEIYKAQTARSSLERNATNLGDFLMSLQMKIKIAEADSFSMPRIAQLTQKTNQFNLTTKRYTEADLQQMIDSKQYQIFSVSAVDRFGDHGLIGVFILKLVSKTCEIDTLLLSCRVISRTIEQSMLAFIIEFAEKNNCQETIGCYMPTSKNKQVSDFYSKFGFTQFEENKYKLPLTGTSQIDYSLYVVLM